MEEPNRTLPISALKHLVLVLTELFLLMGLETEAWIRLFTTDHQSEPLMKEIGPSDWCIMGLRPGRDSRGADISGSAQPPSGPTIQSRNTPGMSVMGGGRKRF
ncbi:hypothetical protein AMECASPLE_029323 [Ameca splendens]|uniref:Uncharacterized protein n=1 Tax=Ameca splendens TaxID=208324 RepID=A0ABV0YU38_9TELE